MSSVAENSETLKKSYALQKGVQGELQPGTSGFFYHLWSVVFLIFLFYVRIRSQLTQKPFDDVSFFEQNVILNLQEREISSLMIILKMSYLKRIF